MNSQTDKDQPIERWGVRLDGQTREIWFGGEESQAHMVIQIKALIKRLERAIERNFSGIKLENTDDD